MTRTPDTSLARYRALRDHYAEQLADADPVPLLALLTAAPALVVVRLPPDTEEDIDPLVELELPKDMEPSPEDLRQFLVGWSPNGPNARY